MKVLVIAPHPDDEAIGLGGQIRLHVLAGDQVEVLILTQGEKGRPGEDETETAKLRIHEAFESALVLGSTVLGYADYPDGDLKSREDEAANYVSAILAREKPDRVYVTSIYDGHVDHRAANLIVLKAIAQGIHLPEIWMYEVWTPLPEYSDVIDITDVIGVKLRAIRRHESQVNRIRFDEAALALARFRGELHNRPHGPYAEVFKKVVI